MFNSKYPEVAFRDILSRVERKVELNDSDEYKTVGLKWYGLGGYIREIKLGMNIKRKKQWIVKRGDVLYNKLFAWKGGFAIAEQNIDGCIVSDKFPTYKINADAIMPDYLRLWFKTPFIASQAQTLSKGAAAISKLTLNPPDFYDLKIPLPGNDEQEKIAQKATKLLSKITSIIITVMTSISSQNLILV